MPVVTSRYLGSSCVRWLSVLLLSSSLVFFIGGLSVAQELTNQDCLDCHSDEGLTREGPGGESESLFVDQGTFEDTVHAGFSCTDCHGGIGEIPHEDDLPEVACSDCHPDVEDTLAASVHGSEAARRETSCQSCHGEPHSIFSPDDPRSTVYPLNVYRTCGTCHFETAPPAPGEAAPLSFERYQDDIHGRGIVKSGLIVSATCVSCHGSHEILPSVDAQATVNRENIVSTCGTCHVGNAEDFQSGAHGVALQDGDADAPTCVTCHEPHQIQRVEAEQVLRINRTCGSCHDSRQKSYTETYHGKVTALGFTGVASCDACHRAHWILPESDPQSSIHPDNRLATCATCHEGANESFASYLVHVDHDHLEEYPILDWVSWGMTGLLLGVFIFFGLHTLLWLYRSLKERRAAPPPVTPPGASGISSSYVRRLTSSQRAMHAVVIVSFLGLALTGLPLKFNEEPWARPLVVMLGGIQMTSALHRLCAVLTFGYFFVHLGQIAYRVLVKREKGLLYGPASMVPRGKDCTDLFGVFRWFVGKGERPGFDRWAYWEKFDYWAVFWGVAIIGSSGLIMAFPTYVTRLLPGWTINVALIVHSDEALLATGFIFAIHFFNTHLKPEKFPMDTVYFTGRVPLHDYEREHPLEVERLRAGGALEDVLAPAPSERELRRARFWGFVAVGVGLILLWLIITAELFQ